MAQQLDWAQTHLLPSIIPITYSQNAHYKKLHMTVLFAATATFAGGVPTVAVAEAPKIWFAKAVRRRALAAAVVVVDTPETHYAANTATPLANALTVTGSSTGLSCSYAGGCLFEVTANDLATQLASSPGNQRSC